MGRVPTKSTQYYQGLQVQELNRNQSPEPIDEEPPEPSTVSDDKDQDLYAPPIESANKKDQQKSSAQSFPPSSQNEQPQAFPPPEEYETPQPFPPPHHETLPQAFPPAPESHFHHQPNVGMFPQQQAFHQQQVFLNQPPPPLGHQQPPPVGGGAQMGHPMAMNQPSPYLHPQQMGHPMAMNQPWKTGLFGCMDDPSNAIITACFPCVTFGQIAEILDSGNTSCGTSGMLYGLIASCLGIPCIISCSYRSKLRTRYGLIESPAPDWLVHCCCETCALCQEYRELKLRDIDPTIGWHGNVAMQQRKQKLAGMVPPMQQRIM